MEADRKGNQRVHTAVMALLVSRCMQDSGAQPGYEIASISHRSPGCMGPIAGLYLAKDQGIRCPASPEANGPLKSRNLVGFFVLPQYQQEVPSVAYLVVTSSRDSVLCLVWWVGW